MPTTCTVSFLCLPENIFGYEPLQHLIPSDELSSPLDVLDSEIETKTLNTIAKRTYKFMKKRLQSEVVAQIEFRMLPSECPLSFCVGIARSVIVVGTYYPSRGQKAI
jgi:hypothetical protein